MTTILGGVRGGLFVGLLATIPARIAGHDPATESTPVEAPLGRGGEDTVLRAFSTGGLYGAIAGGSLVALELFVLGVLAVPPTTLAAFGVAIAWSAILFGMASAVRRLSSGSALGGVPLRELLVFHLVYGLGLGIWLRVTWIT